jgi:hypothetical protein
MYGLKKNKIYEDRFRNSFISATGNLMFFLAKYQKVSNIYKTDDNEQFIRPLDYSQVIPKSIYGYLVSYFGQNSDIKEKI